MEIFNINIDAPIGNSKGDINNAFIREQIKQAQKEGAKELKLIINSPGGEVYEGFSIYNTLKNSGFSISAFITGLCASITTLIASAADKIEMSETAQWMIHEAQGGAEGKAGDLEDTARGMRQINDIIAQNYSRRTGKSLEEIKEAMAFDNYMTPQQAKEFGFIDNVRMPIAAYGEFNPSNKNNMDNKVINALKDGFGSIEKLLGKAMKNNIVAGQEPLADGNSILYFEGDLATGKAAFLNAEMTEKASPGEHALANGKIIVVDDAGVIVDIREVEASAEEQLTEALAQVETLTAENTRLSGEIESMKTEHATALTEINTQLTALKGKVFNNTAPLKTAKQVESKGADTSNALEMQAQAMKQKFGLNK